MWRSKITPYIVGVFITIGGMVAAGPSYAVPTCDASGCIGLVVDTVTYDVTFVHDTYNNVYTSTPPTFLGNGVPGASDASQALADALNSSGVTALIGLTPPNGTIYLEVPFAVDTAGDLNFGFSAACVTSSFFSISCGSPWLGRLATEKNNSITYTYLDFTVFTPVSGVPGPIAGAGLPGLVFAAGGLLAWCRRKRAAFVALAV